MTVDHGLRPESAREARAVKRLAGKLGIRHRTLRWTGSKPTTALQEEARHVRYQLLAAAARGAGAPCVLTAHTLDDQAETVLLRMARGSGLSGLGAMVRQTLLPITGLHTTGATGKKTAKKTAIVLVRPLLDLPKARLIATLAAMGISFVDDPSNRDPRFTRPRLRELMSALAAGTELAAPGAGTSKPVADWLMSKTDFPLTCCAMQCASASAKLIFW